jgi:hypothetical protein
MFGKMGDNRSQETDVLVLQEPYLHVYSDPENLIFKAMNGKNGSYRQTQIPFHLNMPPQ